MSRESMDVAQKALDAFNRRDREAWFALNDPEVEAFPPRDWPESDAIRGREAVWESYVENIEAFREGALEHAELIDAGDDKVVAHMRGEMHGKASGASEALSDWPESTCRDGRTLRPEGFADPNEALDAARLGQRAGSQTNERGGGGVGEAARWG